VEEEEEEEEKEKEEEKEEEEEARGDDLTMMMMMTSFHYWYTSRKCLLYPRWICAFTYEFSRCKNYDLFYHSKSTPYVEIILA